jgi:hypothetical protein
MRPVSGGWSFAASLGGGPDLEDRYRELCQSGRLTLEDMHPRGGEEKAQRRLAKRQRALERPSALDGLALRVETVEREWLDHRHRRRRERRTLAVAGRLPRETLEAIERLRGQAADLYATMRREGSAWFGYGALPEVLPAESERATVQRELNRLAAADGYELGGERMDDFGEHLSLRPR